ncbi:ABC transporter permease subunit [Thalassomonas viridans]|uniref:ABC transporter permease subunit n=1 Tax=Thalassomonas viridans TaxID=137584 RepID=A0AAE9Z941_9GAMM|nr:DUF3526 domain-containing protein [Thalassomonas viridans]WDE09041.1 ABC transporter permease subunit [Thalassomonas viridans]
MNQLICLNEIKNLKRERLLWLVLAVTVCFSVLALYNGARWAEVQSQVVAAAQQEQQQAISSARQGLAKRQALTKPVNWWDDVYDLRGQAFYLMVNYAVKPPLPSAAMAVGQSDVQPYFFRMLVSEKQAFINHYDFAHPLGLLLGKFDLAFFIIYILPVLLISMSYNALAGEKQTGQLRLLMLQGLSPMRLIFNQLCIRTSVVSLPLLLVCITGFFILSDNIGLLSVSVFTVLVLAYSLFWLALCAFVISYGKTPAYNAAVLIVTWLSLIIILPAVLNTLILTSDPAPSRIEYVDTLRDKSDEVDKSSSKALAQFFQDHPELAKPVDDAKPVDYATKKIAKITAIEAAMQPYDDAFQSVLAAQQDRAELLKMISPASLLQGALFDLSGNGLKRHQEFIDQVLAHHHALRAFYQQRIAEANSRDDFTPCAGCNARITLPDLSQVPEFSYREAPLDVSWGSIMLLLLFSFVLLFSARQRLTLMNSGQMLGEPA